MTWLYLSRDRQQKICMEERCYNVHKCKKKKKKFNFSWYLHRHCSEHTCIAKARFWGLQCQDLVQFCILHGCPKPPAVDGMCCCSHLLLFDGIRAQSNVTQVTPPVWTTGMRWSRLSCPSWKWSSVDEGKEKAVFCGGPRMWELCNTGAHLRDK